MRKLFGMINKGIRGGGGGESEGGFEDEALDDSYEDADVTESGTYTQQLSVSYTQQPPFTYSQLTTSYNQLAAGLVHREIEQGRIQGG